MAPLANMFKMRRWNVTGSDKGIFPPMSDYLEKRKINIELGFKEEHLKGSYYKFKKKYPDARLLDPQDVRTIYLVAFDPLLYHDAAIASHRPRGMTRQAALRKMLGPFSRALSSFG